MEGVIFETEPERKVTTTTSEESPKDIVDFSKNGIEIANSEERSVETSDLTFNGFDLLDSAETLKCTLGPNEQGGFIDVEISLMDYEIMCK